MKQNLIYIIGGIAIAISFYLGTIIKKCPEPVDVVIVVHDTLMVQDTVFVEKVKAEIKYVTITEIKKDTIIVYHDLAVATGDTSIDSVGYFRANYYFPPANYFDFYIEPAPRRVRTITLTKYIEVYPPWYEKPLWGLTGFGLGLGTGVILK